MNATKILIREATLDDAAALVAVVNRAYQPERFFIEGDRTDLADVNERLSRPHARFLVIDDAEAPAGIAGCVYMELREDSGYFGMLAVDPERQKRGLALRLIEAVEERCHAAGRDILMLDMVNLRKELPAFYGKLGFRKIGTAPFLDPHLTQPAHLVVMAKQL